MTRKIFLLARPRTNPPSYWPRDADGNLAWVTINPRIGWQATEDPKLAFPESLRQEVVDLFEEDNSADERTWEYLVKPSTVKIRRKAKKCPPKVSKRGR